MARLRAEEIVGEEWAAWYGLSPLADSANLANLRRALAGMDAELIAVPAFEQELLLRVHAIHYRCHRGDVAGLRIDLMSSLRGVAGFEELWERRTTVSVEGESIDLMGIEDLVRAKKTQRDKDWPMIQRLVERSYFERPDNAAENLVRFWLRELRSPGVLSGGTGNYRISAPVTLTLARSSLRLENCRGGDDVLQERFRHLAPDGF